jgi:hypothetical protein
MFAIRKGSVRQDDNLAIVFKLIRYENLSEAGLKFCFGEKDGVL